MEFGQIPERLICLEGSQGIDPPVFYSHDEWQQGVEWDNIAEDGGGGR